MKQVYLICGWVVAACAILALILLVVAERHSGGDVIVHTICEVTYLGITATLALLYFADWIKNKNLLFIMAWVVAGLAILAFIMALIIGGGGAGLVGSIFFTIFTGLASTLGLLCLSGKKG
jgi:hypothetical protein